MLVFFAVALCLHWAGAAEASPEITVEVRVESDVVYVDEPFVIEFVITDHIGNTGRPVIPEVNGLQVSSRPTSTSRRSFNGRNSMRVGYQAIATIEGVMEIGPITMDIGAERFTMEPFTIRVRRPENSDLLTVGIRTEPERVYAGQMFTLIADVRIKQSVDQESGVVLDKARMWGHIRNHSQWSVWTNIVHDVSRMRRVFDRATTEEVTEPDGTVSRYFNYELRRETRAHSSGELRIDPLSVAMSYPLEIRLERDFFGDLRPQVVRATRLMARPDTESILVLPIPTEGRPDSFSGAVGQFAFRTTASSTSVRVDDPFELIYQIEDRSMLPISMQLLGPPNVDAEKVFGDDFRVREGELAGEIFGGRQDGRFRKKLFRQQMRVMNEDVQRIPPIEFSFFDPETERFVTIRSLPIDLDVSPVERVDIDGLLGDPGENVGVGVGDAEEVEPEPGPIRTQLELAFADGPSTLGATHTVTLLAPAVVYGLVLFAVRTRRRSHADEAVLRKRAALKHGRERLRDAAGRQGASAASGVSHAIGLYVADVCRVDVESATPRDVRRWLSDQPISADLIARTTQLMERCDAWSFQPGQSDDLEEIARQADEIMTTLHEALGG